MVLQWYCTGTAAMFKTRGICVDVLKTRRPARLRPALVEHAAKIPADIGPTVSILLRHARACRAAAAHGANGRHPAAAAHTRRAKRRIRQRASRRRAARRGGTARWRLAPPRKNRPHWTHGCAACLGSRGCATPDQLGGAGASLPPACARQAGPHRCERRRSLGGGDRDMAQMHPPSNGEAPSSCRAKVKPLGQTHLCNSHRLLMLHPEGDQS